MSAGDSIALMAVAARVNPKDYFSTARSGRRLSARSLWKGLALVAHGWAVIALATVVALRWPVTLPIAVMVIGARQLGLAILMHDAAHGALHPNLKVNDWVAEWLCLGGVAPYRKYHLQHHKFAQQAEDPDLGLSAPFPISRASFRRKVVRDLTGQTWFKQTVRSSDLEAGGAQAGRTASCRSWSDELRRQSRWLIFNGLAIAAFAAAGYWWGWFALWLLPRATWYQLVTRLRNIAEHARMAKDEPDPLRHARSTRANWIERALIAPYWVQYPRRAPHVHAHAVLEPAPRRTTARALRGEGPDGDGAGLSRGDPPRRAGRALQAA